MVTTTLTVPAACAVVVPLMLVAVIVDTVRAEPLNDAVAPVWNPVPAIETDVPPPLGPLFGATMLTVGGARYVKQLLHAPLCASGFVTTTLTVPAACALVVPVMVVAVIVDTVRADPPNDTVAPVWKPVPAMETDVPPALGPLFGVTEETVGAATYVKQLAHEPLWASGFVTTTFTVPAACDVVVPVMLDAVIVDTVRADPPNDTVAPAWNPAPLTVTDVPPVLGPLFGVTELTVGPPR